MHEYSIVAALIDSVEREAAARGAERVHRVQVAIGELAGVELPLLETAFETFRERTICSEAELAIRQVAARWTCPRCEETLPRGALLRCARCAVPARLACGDEIILQSIEMEAPDV